MRPSSSNGGSRARRLSDTGAEIESADAIGTRDARSAGTTAEQRVAELAADVRDGLTRTQKTLPAKYLYDPLGMALFEAITELPEYGLTRAEERILDRHAEEIVARVPADIVVAELGAGSGRKTVRLLDAVLARQEAVTYVPIDLSETAQELCARVIGTRAGVRFQPFIGSYLDGLAHLSATRPHGTPLLLLFLGSSIGNFDEREQGQFLASVRAKLRPGDSFLLGADLQKPVDRLIAAYDDPLGVTAAFNLNVIARINRELGGDFDISGFRHEARWSERHKRVEMHLRSLRPQIVNIPGAGCRIALREGETIWTESSYKFAAADLEGLAAAAGFTEVRQWIDETWPFADVLWRVGRPERDH